MKKKAIKNEIVIYQAKNGAIEFRKDLRAETIWATQAQIAGAFDVDIRTVNEHIKNIYKSDELKQGTTIRNFRIVQKEGGREINRKVLHYNLDLVLSVGYRVNSKRATLFRQWATKTLRAHIIDGYTINRARIAQNYEVFLKAVEDVKKLLPTGGAVDIVNILELIKTFASTWVSLDAYDKSALPKSGATKKQVKLTAQDFSAALLELRQELTAKKGASELFVVEHQKGSVTGIVGNVLQSFGGKDLYPSVEEKAAHLLYFMVKNHPFTDGNKRAGAFSFIWFLKKAGLLNTARLTPEALTALTLLVAESSPKDKERVVGLVLLLLKK
jgi:prophage maintenance system killer protein